MLDTLIKIGKWRAENMKPIERFLVKPKIDDKKTWYVLNIVFDLDAQDIYSEILKRYSEKDPVKFLLLKTLPGNNKAIYATVEKKKTESLLKTFFGKINREDLLNVRHGELFLRAKEVEACEDFFKLLNEITKLKNVLIEKITDEKDESKLNPKRLFPNLNRGEDIAMIVASVKAVDFGYNEATPVSQIDSYSKFIEKNFLQEDSKENTSQKLCYATGETKDDVEGLKLETRYSLNKMFVTETKNFASWFNKKNFQKNYQISKEYQKYLDLASTFLLEKYKVPIAGVQHVLIPTFLSNADVDFEMIFDLSVKQTDYLLKHNQINTFNTNITDWGDNLYWLNFISIDSDGNYFKSNDFIKDISIPYFVKVIQTLDKLNDFLAAQYASNIFYNLYHFYNYIPVKNDTNRNEALDLFKDILEHRPIDKDVLFRHFIRYMIVQRSGQFDKGYHRAFKNIRQQKEFDYAIKNGVMTYLVFFKFLKLINLLNNKDMEENIENLKPIEDVKNDYGLRIEKFFDDMSYNETQKALFYLGRVLSQVAYAQFQKGHKNKPFLNKLNYNGMDKDAVMRLRLDLAEKAKQYNIVNNVEYNFSQFTHLFHPNETENQLTNEENVFYILSGYSFGMIKDRETDEDENKEVN
jgi:CRISPR-associated protein Csh1